MTTADPEVFVALAGSPNAGKSVLFNSLTGLNQKVGNYPGVTVERKVGTSKPWNGKSFTIIDLPGTYSLDPISLDEQVAFDVLFGARTYDTPKPNVVVAVVDAANLERTLGLVLELKLTGLPMVVALNMMDLAQKRGLKLNTKILQKELGVTVVPMIATRGDGLAALMTEIDRLSGKDHTGPSAWVTPTQEIVSARYQEVDRVLKEAVESPTRADMLTWKIDRVVLHPVWGTAILFFFLLMMFQAVFTWAAPAADLIDGSIVSLSELVKTILPEGIISDLLTDGIIMGVGSVLVFLPQIVLLFFFINLLEASGYMTRAAFILDRMMFACGLQGRSFVPLLSSFACAIPGVMAARSIRGDRDRLITIMVAPLMTCSARLPVYTLLIGAFVADTTVLGFNLQGLAMFSLFVVGIISAFLVAWVTRLLGGKRSASCFMLEMPAYRAPYWKYVFTSIWMRSKAFLQRAGTLILASSIAIWILSNYPKAPEDRGDRPAITYSFAGIIGDALEPIVRPIGFDWRIAAGLIPGMAAREVMVSSLATVFAVETNDDEEAQMKSLEEHVRGAWAPATGFSLLAWYIFAPQCMATIATVRREAGGWKWALVMTTYMFALAWIAAFVTFRVFS